MAIVDGTAKNWSHILKYFNNLDDGKPFDMRRLYRGQSDCEWHLSDSFSRLIPSGMSKDDALKCEQEATRYFVARAGLHLDSSMIPDDRKLIDWWALMQHFGAPTRLLDWSLSPYIALYFAVAENWNRAGAVWNVEYRERLDDDLDVYRKHLERGGSEADLFWDTPDVPDFCFFIDLGKLHIRTAIQHGRFSVCGRIPSAHDLVLGKTAAGTRRLRRLIIPADLKATCLHKLRMMNIAPHSLFPGLDGLGGTVRDATKLHLHRTVSGPK
jgi:hypothetical protein